MLSFRFGFFGGREVPKVILRAVLMWEVLVMTLIMIYVEVFLKQRQEAAWSCINPVLTQMSRVQ